MNTVSVYIIITFAEEETYVTGPDRVCTFVC